MRPGRRKPGSAGHLTPFGIRIRELREERGVSQKEMAASLGVSAAYLSALEKGRRGKPSWEFLQRIIGYFNVIWDDAEELERLAAYSDPKVLVNTEELSAEATDLANTLALRIGELSKQDLNELKRDIVGRANRRN